MFAAIRKFLTRQPPPPAYPSALFGGARLPIGFQLIADGDTVIDVPLSYSDDRDFDRYEDDTFWLGPTIP
jgi:hypothetical protein